MDVTGSGAGAAGWGALIIFLVLALSAAVILSIRRRFAAGWGVISVLIAGGAMGVCLLAAATGVVAAKPAGDPQETVTGFFDALSAGDYDLAYTYLGTYSDLGLANTPSDQVGQAMADALRRSYSYALSGECVQEKLSARQAVRFTYLRLPSAESVAAEGVMDVLSGFVETRPAGQLYDSEKNYLPEVAREAYYTAVTAVLDDPEEYYVTTELSLELQYADGRWLLIPGRELLSAVAGDAVAVGMYSDAGAAAGRQQIDMMSQLDAYANNAASSALSGITYIRKHYTIPENATSAPAPNPDLYGATLDPQEVMAVIESAADLLQGREMSFDPDANFQKDREIRYYCDETILAIAWKEIIDGKCCSCAEVVIADGSQIRRKLSGDTYGNGIRLYASDMAKDANAVVAINGDFYDFRSVGITAYQRRLYRCNDPTLDTCFFTASGDMLFSYAGEHTDWDETQRYIDDNDILFGVTFGPILVDNGELRTVREYPLGTINRDYSRACIGMLGERHYFLMTVNFDLNYLTTATIQQVGQFMYDKGCVKAYALDGGQTSVLLMGGELVNLVDFGNERPMSDLIYFGTALTEEALP